MAFQLNPKGYASWLVQRALLQPLEKLVLDSALDGFIRPAATPGGKPQEKERAPMSYNEWTLQRAQLSDAQATALDTVAQALIDLRKKQKPTVPATPPPGIPPPTDRPDWWKQILVAAISRSGPGSQTIIPQKPGYKHFVTHIVFTVSNETNITLVFGPLGSSGSMDFGGVDEPRATAIVMAESPTPCGEGPLTITSDGANANVGGFVVYSQEKEPRVPKK